MKKLNSNPIKEPCAYCGDRATHTRDVYDPDGILVDVAYCDECGDAVDDGRIGNYNQEYN